MRLFKLATPIAVILILWAASARTEDLREQYGTRNLDVARHIDAAIKLTNANKPDEASKEINKAVAGDPSSAMAWFWKGEIDCNLGELEQSIETYKKCIALESDPGNQVVITVAKTNLGLLLGQLQRYDESAFWLSRSIVGAANNQASEQAKAYRNLAITLHSQHRDFAAAIAAHRGHELDSSRVAPKMIEDFAKAAKKQDSARILSLDEPAAEVSPRKGSADFKQVEQPVPIGEKVVRLLPDPRGKYVLAFTDKGSFYIVEARLQKPLQVRKVTIASGPITTAGLAGGKLYAVVDSVAKMFAVDPLTGAVGQSWDLGSESPKTLAVLPSKQAAFFSSSDRVQRLDLSDGKITDTELPGQFITADPSEQYVYARIKSQRHIRHHGPILINGRPIFFLPEADDSDWMQTTLFRYYVGADRLFIAAVRLNVASNGYDVVVSPDGRWVSVPGGGGWRPESGKGGGYTIPVFAAADFDVVRRDFALDAYPVACAFNPVTHEFVGLRDSDAKIYHLATDSPATPAVTLGGTFNGAVTWTGDGRFLILGNKGNGITVYQHELTASEVTFAREWWKKILPDPAAEVVHRTVSTAKWKPRTIDALKHFDPSSDRAVLTKSLAAAVEIKATDKPVAWRQVPQYVSNPDSMAAIRGISNGSANGVQIYALRKALAKDPESVPLSFYLARSLRAGGLQSAAKPLFLRAIQADAGQSDISSQALTDLADILFREQQDVSAAHCYASALMVDRINSDALRGLVPLLEKLKFADEAKRFARDVADDSSNDRSSNSFELPRPLPTAARIPAAAIYRRAVTSTVLIRCEDDSGTGVCVDKGGIILTSLHVVAGRTNIEVYPFAVTNGKASRLPACAAEMIANSKQDDLAILRINSPPASLKPLLIASSSPAIGARVFALGNPGWGINTLDLTFTDGVVSAVDRAIHETKYLQHTAAVNPGNSGGPLLDETGSVVGLICVKSDLDGISFATPPEAIRALFAKSARQN